MEMIRICRKKNTTEQNRFMTKIKSKQSRKKIIYRRYIKILSTIATTTIDVAPNQHMIKQNNKKVDIRTKMLLYFF